ncbi:MAG: pSer/pThr/pTyr-binding forkhead associated (FHA) protein [Polyangiales bacterium]|jgi:pSer/pThr/pTyr-binding forkhead associated (FHA) protein
MLPAAWIGGISVIVCPRCSKENQDHYKFCLGCGAELPRDQAQPKSFSAPTPPAGVEVDAAPAAAPLPPQPSDCPNCSSSVPPNFKFCGSCGHDMTSAPAAAQSAPPSAAPPSAAPPSAAPSAEAPAASFAAPPVGASEGSLTLIRPDGSEGDTFPLGATTIIGRESQGPFSSDSYLSPQHAEFVLSNGSATVTDLDSLNGVYIRIDRDTPTELTNESIFRIGQEILEFEAFGETQPGADGTVTMGSQNPGYFGRIRLVTGRTSYGNCFPIGTDGMHLGRERGDIIFPDDGYVSGLHCRIHSEGGRVFLTDVGSSNGTFIRAEGQQQLTKGSLLLMGQQLFRLDC